MTDVESSFHPALKAVREMGKKEDKEMIRENKNWDFFILFGLKLIRNQLEILM